MPQSQTGLKASVLAGSKYICHELVSKLAKPIILEMNQEGCDESFGRDGG